MSYDLAIIGSGTAAQTAAMRVREAGWTVAVIDNKPLGGTCALRGCDPKKMLVTGAEAVELARRMRGRGVAGGLRIDWPRLMAFKRTFTDPIPEKQEHRYQERGIDVLHGLAHFTGPNALDVAGTAVEATHILIAAGAEPISLGIPGEALLLSSEDFLNMKILPPRIILVGGGYIAAEFSNIAARAGSQVTVLQRGERMLAHFEPELVGWLMEAFQAVGIDVRTGSAVRKVEKVSDGYRVQAATTQGVETFEADVVIHAAGRAPALDGLDLQAGQVASNNGKLRLNDFLQSESNPAVYAAGDSAQKGPPLTPVSNHDARVVAANLLGGNHQTPNYLGVPSAAFTLPPIASVGMSGAEAHEHRSKIVVRCERTSGWYSARRVAQPVSGYKTIVDKKTDKVLGAHLVGPDADQVINIFGLAIRQGLRSSDLKGTMFAYPTGASDISSMI